MVGQWRGKRRGGSGQGGGFGVMGWDGLGCDDGEDGVLKLYETIINAPMADL